MISRVAFLPLILCQLQAKPPNASGDFVRGRRYTPFLFYSTTYISSVKQIALNLYQSVFQSACDLFFFF